MGLESYAYFIKNNVHNSQLDNEEENFTYWNKNNFLNDWMENLFYRKGGEGIFNCRQVFLTVEDLHALKKDIKQERSKHLSEYLTYDAAKDYHFALRAIKHIQDGGEVYFESWW